MCVCVFEMSYRSGNLRIDVHIYRNHLPTRRFENEGVTRDMDEIKCIVSMLNFV